MHGLTETGLQSGRCLLNTNRARQRILTRSSFAMNEPILSLVGVDTNGLSTFVWPKQPRP